MQNSQFNLGVILLVVLGGLGYTVAQDGLPGGDSVKAIESWSAKHVKRQVLDAAPKARTIASEKEWETLWNRWRPTEELPHVDFGKELIVVGTAMGRNTCTVSPTLDKKGNLKVEVTSTLMADDMKTFGYVIVKISAEGIKTIDGKPFGKN